MWRWIPFPIILLRISAFIVINQTGTWFSFLAYSYLVLASGWCWLLEWGSKHSSLLCWIDYFEEDGRFFCSVWWSSAVPASSFGFIVHKPAWPPVASQTMVVLRGGSIQKENCSLTPRLKPPWLPRVRAIPWQWVGRLCLCLSTKLPHATLLTLLDDTIFHCWPLPSLTPAATVMSPAPPLSTAHGPLHFSLSCLSISYLFIVLVPGCLLLHPGSYGFNKLFT